MVMLEYHLPFSSFSLKTYFEFCPVHLFLAFTSPVICIGYVFGLLFYGMFNFMFLLLLMVAESRDEVQ